MANVAIVDTLHELIAQAEADLNDRAGGASLCTLTRAGISVPGVKYSEGRWAALREVQRASKRSPTDSAEAARFSLESWQAALESVRARDAAVDWIAYRSGGVDALHQLLEAHPIGKATP